MNGLFSIGVLDRENKQFAILNDRFGLAHQIYWTTLNGRFYFATHLKTLLACSSISTEINHEGLNLFLKYSYIPSPRTIFKHINKLSPGQCLVYNNGEVKQNTYWQFEAESSISSMEEATLNYKRLLSSSIDMRLSAGDGVGILLSGGLDSSANVALAAQCTEQRLKTFAIGFEDPKFDESPYARIVAKHFNTQHFEYTITGREIEDLPKMIWHLEEPYFEFGLFLTYLGMSSAKKQVGVVLGGEGADQMYGTGGFAGGRPVALRYLLMKYGLLGAAGQAHRLLKGKYFYDYDNLAFKIRLLLGRVTKLNDWYYYGYDQHELNSLRTSPDLAAIPDIFPERTTSKPASFFELYKQTQVNQDIKHYVNENVMVKSGRMADMLGLTLRESYLDKDVADFLVSLDYRYKRSGDVMDHLKGNITTKFLHRKAMEDLLPEEIMKKPKQGGFVPVMLFLKDADLRKRIYHHLLQSETMKAYFSREYLNSLFSGYEKNQGKKIYWHNFYNSKANRILFLLTFDIWHHFYLTNDVLNVQPMPLSEYLR